MRREKESRSAALTDRMKTVSGGSGSFPVGNMKLQQKRNRKISTDSGCDVLAEYPDLSSSMMEDTIDTWEIRMKGVVKQEAERARNGAKRARDDIRNAHEVFDEEEHLEVLNRWRNQFDEIMEFTKDLIDCVNNETREIMHDKLGQSSDNESTSTIDEIDEDDEEKEEELMKLFPSSPMEGMNSALRLRKPGSKSILKEFISIYKKHGQIFRTSRKANKEVHAAHSKLMQQEKLTKTQHPIEEINFTYNYTSKEDFAHSEKMFDSVLEFDDCYCTQGKNIFPEWKWNLSEAELEKKLKHHHDQEIKVDYTELNFDPVLNGEHGNEKSITDSDNIHDSLLSSVGHQAVEESLGNFVYQTTDNYFKLQPLDELIWDFDELIWNFLTVDITGKESVSAMNMLVTTDDEENEPNVYKELFPWEDPDNLTMLFSYEDIFDLMSLCYNHDINNSKHIIDEMMMEGQCKNEDEKTDWINWVFWNDFGSAFDILKEYEYTMNAENEKLEDDNLHFWTKFDKIGTYNNHRISRRNYSEIKTINQRLIAKEDQKTNWINWHFWTDFSSVPDFMNAYTYKENKSIYGRVSELGHNRKIKQADQISECTTLTEDVEEKSQKSIRKDPATNVSLANPTGEDIFQRISALRRTRESLTDESDQVLDRALEKQLKFRQRELDTLFLKDKRTEKKRQPRGY